MKPIYDMCGKGSGYKDIGNLWDDIIKPYPVQTPLKKLDFFKQDDMYGGV